MIISMHLRGEEVDVECSVCPAEPDVGIFSLYADGWRVLGHPDWELTEQEIEELQTAVAEL